MPGWGTRRKNGGADSGGFRKDRKTRRLRRFFPLSVVENIGFEIRPGECYPITHVMR